MSDDYVILIESVIGKVLLLFYLLGIILRKIYFAEVLLIRDSLIHGWYMCKKIIRESEFRSLCQRESEIERNQILGRLSNIVVAL